MAHDSFDDLFESPDEPGNDGGPRGRRAASRGNDKPSGIQRCLPLLLVVLVLAGLGLGAYEGYKWVTGHRIEQEADDYTGSGSGEAVITVEDGDTGTDIAKKMVEKDVIKSTGPFVTLFANEPKAASIHPGQYKLKKQMSSSAALDALLDPQSAAGVRVTIPEGSPNKVVFKTLSKQTGIPVAEFEKAAKDYTALGIPENKAKSAEGYLWPGTYTFSDDADAKEILTEMAGRMQSKMEEKGIPAKKQHDVLTRASIVEREARSDEDFGKVARTIDNRLKGVGEAGGTPMALQVDSTVAYAVGDVRKGYSTTPKERAIDSPYNTYKHKGLPIGPISNPGDRSIDAVLNPPKGDWLYWVTVNTDTGETKFATTNAEHEKYVKEWREWAKNK